MTVANRLNGNGRTSPALALASDPALFRRNLLIDVDGVAKPFAPEMDAWQSQQFAAIDPAFLDQRLHDGVERLLDDLFCLKLCQPDFLGNGPNNLFLGHDSILL